MPNLKDLLDRLTQRPEVDAVFVVGRDGLLIDQAGANGADGDAVAAMVPNLLQNATEIGSAAEREDVNTAVIEYADGVAIVSDISADMILVTFVTSQQPFGALLYELRHNREQIAKLV